MTGRTIVGVMGGSRATKETAELARRLGELIAKQGWVLLNGGRNSGVMEASARGAREAGGLTLGILPDKVPGAESRFLDLCVYTGLADGRNLINVLSSRVVFACQGEGGTLSEIALAVRNGRPVIAVGWDPGTSFAQYEDEGLLLRTDTPAAAVEHARRLLAEDR